MLRCIPRAREVPVVGTGISPQTQTVRGSRSRPTPDWADKKVIQHAKFWHSAYPTRRSVSYLDKGHTLPLCSLPMQCERGRQMIRWLASCEQHDTALLSVGGERRRDATN
jgi:hypothetical protein